VRVRANPSWEERSPSKKLSPLSDVFGMAKGKSKKASKREDDDDIVLVAVYQLLQEKGCTETAKVLAKEGALKTFELSPVLACNVWRNYINTTTKEFRKALPPSDAESESDSDSPASPPKKTAPTKPKKKTAKSKKAQVKPLTIELT
jgi:hypothetical protein